MKNVLILFIGLVMFASCDSTTQESATETKTEEAKVEPTKEELEASSKKLIAKLVDAKALNLQLNGTDKWLIDDSVFTQLMKIKQQIYVISGNMENYEVSSYNEMGKEFLDFIQTIPVLENEAANTELQKVITNSKKQCGFMKGDDLQSSQIAVINLSIIYEEVPKYFVSSQN